MLSLGKGITAFCSHQNVANLAGGHVAVGSTYASILFNLAGSLTCLNSAELLAQGGISHGAQFVPGYLEPGFGYC